MTDVVLRRRIEFCRAFAECGIEEDRVVAESVGAARCVQDGSVPAAFGDQRRGIVGVSKQYDAAMKMCGALRVRNVAQRVEQLCDIRRAVAMHAGVAGRVEARCAVERIHAQTRIVAERGQSRKSRGVARLEQRIFHKCTRGFLCVGDAKRGLRDEFDVEVGENFTHLAQLAGVAAGEDELHWRRSIKSQRLPYRSRNTTTVPKASWRGDSSKCAPMAVRRAWSRAKSSVCKKKPTRPPCWLPMAVVCAGVVARASSRLKCALPGGAMRTQRLPPPRSSSSSSAKPSASRYQAIASS